MNGLWNFTFFALARKRAHKSGSPSFTHGLLSFQTRHQCFKVMPYGSLNLRRVPNKSGSDSVYYTGQTFSSSLLLLSTGQKNCPSFTIWGTISSFNNGPFSPCLCRLIWNFLLTNISRDFNVTQKTIVGNFGKRNVNKIVF